MSSQLSRRNQFANTLGFVAVAFTVSAMSVHPQTMSSGTSSGNSAMSNQSQPVTPAKGNQSSTGSTGADSSSSNAVGKVSASDRNLMRELAYANLAEISIAKLAQTKSTNDQVRTFAQKMIDDHSKALDQLQQLAQAKGVQLPTEPDARHKAQEKKLNSLSGAAFDKQYMTQAGVTDHRQTHNLVARISRSARDADLKQLASGLMPDIDQHMRMAQDMKKGKGAAQTSSGSSQ